MKNSPVEHWAQILLEFEGLQAASAKNGKHAAGPAFRIRNLVELLEEVDHMPPLKQATWNRLVDSKVLRKLGAGCSSAPGKITPLQVACVMSIGAFINKAVIDKALVPSQHTSSMCSAAAQQLQQSGFLGRLPQLLSTAAAELTAVQDADMTGSAAPAASSLEAVLFTASGKLRLVGLHAYVTSLLMLCAQVVEFITATSCISPSSVPILQLSVTVMKYVSHGINLVETVSPGPRVFFNALSQAAFSASSSVILASAQFLSQDPERQQQASSISFMQSPAILEAISIMLLIAVFPGPRCSTGSTATSSSGGKQHAATQLTRWPQHSPLSAAEWQQLEGLEVRWSAAHLTLLHALGINPRGLAYVAAFYMCGYYSANHTRILVQAYRVFSRRTLLSLAEDTEQVPSFLRSTAPSKAGRKQQSAATSAAPDLLQLHLALPNVMLQWAANQLNTSHTGTDGYANCCLQAVESSNPVLLLAAALITPAEDDEGDDSDDESQASTGSSECWQESRQTSGAAAAAHISSSHALTSAQLAELIELTGQVSRNLLSHIRRVLPEATQSSTAHTSNTASATRSASLTSKGSAQADHAAAGKAGFLSNPPGEACDALKCLVMTVRLLRTISQAMGVSLLQHNGSSSSSIEQVNTLCKDDDVSTSMGYNSLNDLDSMFRLGTPLEDRLESLEAVTRRLSNSGNSAQHAAGSASLSPIAAAWCRHTLEMMAVAEACIRVHQAPQYELFTEFCGMHKPGCDPLIDAALQAGAGSPEQQQLWGLMASMLKVILYRWQQQSSNGGLSSHAATTGIVYASSVVAAVLHGAAAAGAASHSSQAPADPTNPTSKQDSPGSFAGQTSSSSSSAAACSSSTSSSNDSSHMVGASDLRPWLLLLGRCLMATAAQVQQIAKHSETVWGKEDLPGLMAAKQVLGLARPAISNLLQHSSICVGLTTPGYSVLPALQGLLDIDIEPGLRAAFHRKSTASQDSSAVISELAEQLQAAAVSLNALSSSSACNSPQCSNIAGLSERRLVRSRTSCCSACRSARYCGKACQLQHWKQHKPVCKALAAARAAQAAAER